MSLHNGGLFVPLKVLHEKVINTFLIPTRSNRAEYLTHFCLCELRSYEALFTTKAEPSVSPDDPMTLNKVASQTI